MPSCLPGAWGKMHRAFVFASAADADWLGVEIDEAANAAGRDASAATPAAFPFGSFRRNEELMIAPAYATVA